MILTCPACATRYQADDAKFPPEGRRVRCAKCGHLWHQPAPVSEAAPPPEPVIKTPVPVLRPEPESAARPGAPMKPPAPATLRPSMLSKPGVAWIGLTLVVLLLGFSAVHYRQQIAGIYSHLGMTAPNK